MIAPRLAFAAYPSRDEHLLELLRTGIGKANSMTLATRFVPWEFNDIPGTPLVSPILEKIAESNFIVADITYLNLNVVYEIGFAIGNNKRVFLIRHKGTNGDKEIARRVGIFDTLGYFEYQNANDLAHRLTSYIDETSLEFSTIIDFRAPAYVVEPPVKGDAATMMTSRLKKARYRYRSFNPIEDSRLSAMDAIKQVAASAGVLISFEHESKEWGFIHNLRSLFVAGLADGMGKPCLLLCPDGYDAPLDVRDEVKKYRHPDDITEHVAELVLDLTEYLQQADTPTGRVTTSLQNITFGDPTAENEMTTLGAYYLPTDQYNRSLRGEVNLVVGRKGSGKTALFLQLRDRIRSDKRNVMVDLKPEGYQLIKLKEDLLSYLTEGARQHLVTAFWEYLLLLEVTYKVLEKDKLTHKHNHQLNDLYRDLEATYRVENFSDEGDFSERLLMLSNRIASEYQAMFGDSSEVKLTGDQVTSLVYAHDIRALREKLSKYLESKQAVWILFDNLDKGWNTGGVDEIDAIVLRCLIEAGRKIERDMTRRNHSFHCIVFVRNDVYELLMKSSADYGKDMRAVLDWTDPDMLREMLRLRLVSSIDGLDEHTPFDRVWWDICVSHFHGEETSAYIIERSLMRPRNVLKIFAHSKGFASNFNHAKIDESDIEKGIRAYSQDLLVELDHELTDVFPTVPDLLYCFLDCKSELSKVELQSVIRAGGVADTTVEQVLSFLLYYGVIGFKTDAGSQYIFDVNYDSKLLRIRAERLGDSAKYVINPAFWPALGVVDVNNRIK